jgi:hypothetical protein
LLGPPWGFLVAYFFDWLWSKGLTKETARLRNLHELTLYAYFNRDAKVKPRYDAHGKMVGIIVEAAGNAAGGAQISIMWGNFHPKEDKSWAIENVSQVAFSKVSLIFRYRHR